MDVLKKNWEEELGNAEQMLIDAWQSIIKHVVKYVNPDIDCHRKNRED